MGKGDSRGKREGGELTSRERTAPDPPSWVWLAMQPKE
jgi:hypothetical protein